MSTKPDTRQIPDDILQAAIDAACSSLAHEFYMNSATLSPDNSFWPKESNGRLALARGLLARLPSPAASQGSQPAEADPYAELKKAHAEGKVIQYNCASVGYEPEWEDLPDPEFGDGPQSYRIKPEPATFEAHGKTWTRHTPGDPMPCDGEAVIQYLMRDNAWSTEPAGKLRWCKKDNIGDIIGWRYADKPTPEPTQPAPAWQPAVGNVVRLKSGGPVMTITDVDDLHKNIITAWFDGCDAVTMGWPAACLTPAKEAQP
jgi:uncharacterized protein YodC (DUF2158 family)